MTTEEALNVLQKHGFVHEAWRTEDEVWMAAWRWARRQEWWDVFFRDILHEQHDGPYFRIDLIGSPDFMVELAEFLEGR